MEKKIKDYNLMLSILLSFTEVLFVTLIKTRNLCKVHVS